VPSHLLAPPLPFARIPCGQCLYAAARRPFASRRAVTGVAFGLKLVAQAVDVERMGYLTLLRVLSPTTGRGRCSGRLGATLMITQSFLYNAISLTRWC
jgi:hypothetical protein